jgi:hypothetical protein
MNHKSDCSTNNEPAFPKGECDCKNPVIENNFKYHSPKPGQPEKYTDIREKAKELAYLIDEECPNSREKSVAMTKLEEAVMWANASVARN